MRQFTDTVMNYAILLLEYKFLMRVKRILAKNSSEVVLEERDGGRSLRVTLGKLRGRSLNHRSPFLSKLSEDRFGHLMFDLESFSLCYGLQRTRANRHLLAIDEG